MILSISAFLLLLFALSADTFTAGLSYSLNKVRIPFLSILLISFISGLMLTCSFTLGEILLCFIPTRLVNLFSFSLLFLLALYKLYDALPDKTGSSKKLTTDVISEKVNFKDVTYLSPPEAVLLAFLLSIDSISAGLGAGLPPFSSFEIFLLASFMHFAAMYLGLLSGHILSGKSSPRLSYLSAILLLLLAIFRLL